MNKEYTIYKCLEKYFGYKDFRPGQYNVIKHILEGGNTIAVFPTGGGKSICYQLPALVLKGTSIVISPLISLMKDQVDQLKENGIHATFISSTLSEHELSKRIHYMKNGRYKIVYIAPERFYSKSFLEALRGMTIPLVAIDEAHCISQWGHNFRPAYLKIKELINHIGEPIVAAFTATADNRVRQDIISLLGISKCRLFIGSFDRPNLEFCVDHPRDPKGYVLSYVRKQKNKSGIIYASTRKNVEQLFYYLKNNGIRAGMYHAGLDSKQRNQMQEAFIEDSVTVMVATNAFGMGINKGDVRYIIHYNMPKSIENYYQEAGRAGRDGRKASCILLSSREDYRLNRFMIDCNYPPVKLVEKTYNRIIKRGKNGIPVDLILKDNFVDHYGMENALKKLIEYNYVQIINGIVYGIKNRVFDLSQDEINKHKDIEIRKLDIMKNYYESKDCLRRYILEYFNDTPKFENCGNCSVCKKEIGKDKGMDIDSLIKGIFAAEQKNEAGK